nr:MAG TPA: hypothetical protein [Caudoviricetes sp.]
MTYYPFKLIKFYCMESKEQSFKNQIIKDLRAGNLSRNLIKIILGDGALRLRRSQVDVICEWMVQNTNAWRVVIDDKGTVVVFSHTPFRPEDWDNVEDYKHVLRQMFGDFGTKDFLNRRCSMMESYGIRMNLKDLGTMEEAPQAAVYEYVRMVFGDEKVLAMVLEVNDNNEKLVAILSGTGKGQKYWVTSTKEMEVVPDDVAISELVRLKEEWKNKKREEAIAKRREELCEKYGNIRPGTYLRAQNSLYIVDSVDMEDGTAKCVRLVDLGINFPANEKCVLHLENGFKIATPEEVAKILLKEYSNE